MAQLQHAPQTNFYEIVQLIQNGDSRGEELLYTTFMKGLRYVAIRKVGVDDADECIHDTFIAITQKIKQGALREPAALLKYGRTILGRIIMDKFEERRRWNSDVDFETAAANCEDTALSPDKSYEAEVKVQVMKQGLAQLRPQEREILVRFYLKEEDKETICLEMGLTDTQYRLLKSRSKQKLEDFTAAYLTQTTATQSSAAAYV